MLLAILRRGIARARAFGVGVSVFKLFVPPLFSDFSSKSFEVVNTQYYVVNLFGLE